MRQGKRILSVMCALFVLIGLLGVPVFAAGDGQEDYKICYYINDESAPGDQCDEDDLPLYETIMIPDAAELGFERAGFQFSIWNTERDGSGVDVKPGEMYTGELIVEGETTVNLYAQWDPYYVVSYQPNNGTDKPLIKGPYPKEQNFQAVDILDTGFAKPENKSFIGWKDANGNLYQAGEEVSNPSDKSEVKLYAQWREIEQGYDVLYDPGEGEGTTTDPVRYESSTEQFRIADATGLGYAKEGFAFDCWNTKADGSGEDYYPGQVVSNLAEAEATVSFYAQWKPLSYKVAYEANNESGDDPVFMGPYSITADIQIAGIREIGFTNPGHVFTGWKDAKGNSYEAGETYPSLSSKPDKIVRLYAQWKETQDTYWVEYWLNIEGDQRHFEDGPFEITDGTGTDGQFEILENGHHFAGKEFICWNTKADGTGKNYAPGEVVSNLTKKAGSKVNLYAQWKAVENTYWVAYYPNDGSKRPAALTGPCSIGTIFAIITAQNAGFARNGYQFTGWNTKANGTGKAYSAGQKVSDLTDEPGTIVKLYAQWKAKKANPMKVTPKSKSYKAAKLKKKAAKFTISVKNNQGKVTFALNKAAKKAKIKVTTKGKVTVPKKCRKGTYAITVKAAGTDAYNPGTATVKIIVK